MAVGTWWVERNQYSGMDGTERNLNLHSYNVLTNYTATHDSKGKRQYVFTNTQIERTMKDNILVHHKDHVKWRKTFITFK